MEYVFIYVVCAMIFALYLLQKDRYNDTVILANKLKKEDPNSSDEEITHTAMLVSITVCSVFWPIMIVVIAMRKLNEIHND